MGQQVFIPNRGRTDAPNKSVFLTDLYDTDTNGYVNYGLTGDGADLFYRSDDFTAGIAFRLGQRPAGEVISLLRVQDAAGKGYKFEVNASDFIQASVNLVNLTPATTCDMSLGRVFVVVLTYEADGNQASLYINGLLMAQTNEVIPAVTLPVSFFVGPDGSAQAQDYVQFLGFGYAEILFSVADVADTFMDSQDAGRFEWPGTLVVEQNSAIYNADTGFGPVSAPDLSAWIVDFDNLGAPALPANPVLGAQGRLIKGPFHSAHSGWAEPL